MFSDADETIEQPVWLEKTLQMVVHMHKLFDCSAGLHICIGGRQVMYSRFAQQNQVR